MPSSTRGWFAGTQKESEGSWKLASRVQEAADARQGVAGGSDAVRETPENAVHKAATGKPTLQ